MHFIKRVIGMVDKIAVEKAKEHFGKLVEEQLKRVEQMRSGGSWIDYAKLDRIIIGVVGGDGIGPYIGQHARTILEFLLHDAVLQGKVELRTIDGLTIENRVKVMKAIPDDVLSQLKGCHVILKGPTTTPK
jgi:isocitrate dehydrogenase (NAD+)